MALIRIWYISGVSIVLRNWSGPADQEVKSISKWFDQRNIRCIYKSPLSVGTGAGALLFMFMHKPYIFLANLIYILNLANCIDKLYPKPYHTRGVGGGGKLSHATPKLGKNACVLAIIAIKKIYIPVWYCLRQNNYLKIQFKKKRVFYPDMIRVI